MFLRAAIPSCWLALRWTPYAEGEAKLYPSAFTPDMKSPTVSGALPILATTAWRNHSSSQEPSAVPWALVLLRSTECFRIKAKHSSRPLFGCHPASSDDVPSSHDTETELWSSSFGYRPEFCASTGRLLSLNPYRG